MNFFIIFQLLIPIFTVIPLWNFESSTINLLKSEMSEYVYSIYKNSLDGTTIKLEKNISNYDGTIKEINTLYIGSYKKVVEWDDIESSYIYSKIFYICPKGKFHLYKYSNSLSELSPFSGENKENFEKEDWDLQCYSHPSLGYLFVAYLNKNVKLYYYKYDDGSLQEAFDVKEGLYDFKWTTTSIENDIYPMIGIIKDSVMELKGIEAPLKTDSVNGNHVSTKEVTNILSNSFAYFNKDNYTFYFITYNDSDFYSGYSIISELYYKTVQNVESSNIIKHEESPLDFYYDFTIKKMNFTKNTKYVFYELINNVKNKTYHGIIDVILNKIIFNTDEKINSFKPMTNNSMLAITDKSAYKICALANNNNCIDECSSNSYFIDSQHPNFCGTNCSDYILIPNNICINECNDNYFYSNDSYHCGFCIHINKTHPYKLLNSSGCLDTIPNGTYLYNEKYKLLKGIEYVPPTAIIEEKTEIIENIDFCNKSKGLYPLNYNYNGKNRTKCFEKDKKYKRIFYDEINEEFKLCYKTCLTCNQTGNSTHHNCLSCDYDFIFKPEQYEPINNCVPKCNYYYYNSYNQYKCVDELPCPSEANLFIKEKNKCIDDCTRDNKYKYKYNQNCYEVCPNNTIKNNYFCYDKNIDECTITNNVDIYYTPYVQNLDEIIKIYSEEFSYTNNHVTQYSNKDEYNSIIFKNKKCINELNIDYPTINFGNCYDKVIGKYNITGELITVIINKNDEDNNPSTSYSFYDPNTGEKINTTEICKDDKILIVENILSFLDCNSTYHQSLLHLIEQGINIFNISDEFFLNLCYDYDFPTDKDIALQDRIKIFYPNISLCDEGCTITNVDLNNKTAHCECSFNDISDDYTKNNTSKFHLIKDALIENLFGDLFDFFDKSNIAVNKCVENALKKITKLYGTYIILSLFFINIIFSIIFLLYSWKKLKVYIYDNTYNFIQSIENSINIIHMPPLRHKNIERKENKDKTGIYHNENNEHIHITKNIIKHNKKKKKSKTGIYLKNNKIKNLNIIFSINKDQNKSSNKENNSRSTIRLKHNTSKIRLKNISKFKILQSLDKENNKLKKYFDEYFSTPLEEMEFDDAIIKDKRKFCEFFLDEMKDNQIILYTFCVYEPFKPRPIRIILFALNILFYFVIIALFINDDYISKVYYLKGKENFLGFIPRTFDRIVYTTSISIAIEFIVGFFFVKENKKKRIFLREKENKNIIKEQIVLLVKLIKTMYIAFFISIFLIYIICFYYLICFNYVYPCIQIEWIKTSIFIFILRQILSVFQCLLETILRFISFKYKSERIFKTSKLVI